MGPPAEALNVAQNGHPLGAKAPELGPCETATPEPSKSGSGLDILADD